jgi:glycosyltransferase involved in cell wall biosynthesis
MSKYSIILPVRNGGAYLKECVQSILAQTHTDFMLQVLDNCSTDGTPEYLVSLNDPRIKIYPAPQPLSIEENWARIPTLQKNEFITLIGHDDILLPHYLQEMNTLIEQHPLASLYQAHFSYMNESGNFIAHCKPMDEKQYAHEFLACQMARTIDSTGTGYMMRSSDFDAIGGLPADYPNLIFADYKAWVSLSMKSYKATTPALCFYYRIHNSVSKLTNGEEYFNAFDKYVHFMADIRKQDARIDAVINRYGHNMLMYYCESLAHRVLKTPRAKRHIKAASLVERFKAYAALLIPEQQFNPMAVFRISIATKLDNNAAGRVFFGMYKSVTE